MSFVWLALMVARADPTPAVAEPADTSLPTPFTAEQIRQAMPVGLVIDWCPVMEGETGVAQRWAVTAVDTTHVTLRQTLRVIGDERVVSDDLRRFAFVELRSHAEFPKQSARREHRQVDAKVGAGPGWHYVVTEGPGTERHYTFLDRFPGAPVKVALWVEGVEQPDPMEQCGRVAP